MTAEPSRFDLYLLHDDTSYEDWVAFNAAGQESLNQGGNGPGEAVGIADPIEVEVSIRSGRSETLNAPPGDAGTYALQCWTLTVGGIYSLRSAGPVAVPTD